ncbi:MAG: hypothetical protein J7L39_00415 [Candidatus Aenigmarchaeota archaeon]|nr:hypothetical protein [Candidatus Aenigmarchaeota archaeon]
MATGVSQADLAILIVAADEGIKEQTKRHAYLLKLFGISEVIVAINKMDKVNYSKEIFENVREEILNYLEKIGIKPKFVIPISAYNGDNVVKKSEKMEWFNGPTIVEAIDRVEIKKETKDFRMPIQDVFEFDQEKVYLGNVLSGEIKKNEEITVYPEGKKVKVKKILVDEKEIESAKAPKAIGIVTDKNLKRGDILAKGSTPIITKELTTTIFCLIESIEEGKEYVVRCATQEVKGKVVKVEEKIDVETLERFEGKTLKETEIGRVKIKLEKPMVFEKVSNLKELGRFVILKNGKIIAGGIVI